MYPYIQACSDDHSDTVKASPHSNFCAIAAVLQGQNERNSHKHSCWSLHVPDAWENMKFKATMLMGISFIPT